jgi:molybdate transport repressor ModE-like protein
MSIRFDLTDLRLFLHVADAASITHGATRANMTLASASERIRAMETALGAPLLERQRRGVRLTPVGSALVHHARIVTQQLETMRGELSDYAKGLRGHVRLLSNTVAIAELLPTPLASFLSTHPNIDVELEDRPSREIVRTIAEGRADSGIVTDAVDLAEELGRSRSARSVSSWSRRVAIRSADGGQPPFATSWTMTSSACRSAARFRNIWTIMRHAPGGD